MGIPIQECLVYRAALGDEKAYAKLLENLSYNLKAGGFTAYGCNHTPPCPTPTLEQFEALDSRITADIKKRRDQK